MTQSVIPGKRTFEILGNSLKLLVTGEDTNGAYTLMDYVAAPNFAGPPAHRHAFDEFFFVLEGTVILQLGEQTIVVKPGDYAIAPGGSAHTFMNPGDERSRFLCVMSPPGFEAYFGDLEALVGNGEPDPAAIGALMAKYGVTSA